MIRNTYLTAMLAVLFVSVSLTGCGNALGPVDGTVVTPPTTTSTIEFIDPPDLQSRLDDAAKMWGVSTIEPNPDWRYYSSAFRWDGKGFIPMAWENSDTKQAILGDIVAPEWLSLGHKSRTTTYSLYDSDGNTIPSDRYGIWVMRKLGTFEFRHPNPDVKPVRINVVEPGLQITIE